MTAIREVLERARWAPSGDNTQPWRFELVSDSAARIHAYDTRSHCVYDLDGHASQIAHGALLENIAIAATGVNAVACWSVRDESEGGRIAYDVWLEPAAPGTPADPLAPFIERRAVHRAPMRATPLTDPQRRGLAASTAAGYELVLMDDGRSRRAMASINALSTRIRLTIPEAFEVHRSVIEWDATTSEDRIPDAALGASPLLLSTMRFAMGSWRRVDMLNRFAGGTLLPRLMLDWLPGVMCSAHFALIADEPPFTARDYVNAGRAVQRLWLAATATGLSMQPSYTPLVFARYAREGRRFTRVTAADALARRVAQRLEEELGPERVPRTVFLGRLGTPRSNDPARSTRLPLERLLVAPSAAGLTRLRRVR